MNIASHTDSHGTIHGVEAVGKPSNRSANIRLVNMLVQAIRKEKVLLNVWEKEYVTPASIPKVGFTSSPH